MGTTARGQGLARRLPGHLQGHRRSGMEELVLQVCGDERGSPRPSSKWKQQAKKALEAQRCQGEMRRVLRRDQRPAYSKSGSGSARIVEQALAESSTGPALRRVDINMYMYMFTERENWRSRRSSIVN